MREQETKTAIADADIQGMEIESQKAALEQEMSKQMEEDRVRLRSVHWAHERQADIETSLLESALAEQQRKVRRFGVVSVVSSREVHLGRRGCVWSKLRANWPSHSKMHLQSVLTEMWNQD